MECYDLDITFIPEFLHERFAVADFVSQDLLIIGTSYPNSKIDVIKECHKGYYKKLIICDPTEAELVKYFNNVYNATLITFANSFYTICNKLRVSYDNVKSIAVQREHINDTYLNCSEDLRGFGGMCLPKDTKALAYLAKSLGVDVKFFSHLISENAKYKTTVFEGMRL
jgi:UDPglucose 6-dehydrogenase